MNLTLVRRFALIALMGTGFTACFSSQPEAESGTSSFESPLDALDFEALPLTCEGEGFRIQAGQSHFNKGSMPSLFVSIEYQAVKLGRSIISTPHAAERIELDAKDFVWLAIHHEMESHEEFGGYKDIAYFSIELRERQRPNVIQKKVACPDSKPVHTTAGAERYVQQNKIDKVPMVDCDVGKWDAELEACFDLESD